MSTTSRGRGGKKPSSTEAHRPVEFSPPAGRAGATDDHGPRRGASTKDTRSEHEKFPEIPWFIALSTYFSYAMLIAVGHIRDFAGSIFSSRYSPEKQKKGYAVLLKSWESFFTRRLYHRIQDCWNRPICSAAAAHIDVMERASKDGNCTLYTTGKSTHCLNVGSYNYLGFADDWMQTCGNRVLQTLDEWPVSLCTSRSDLGTNSLHLELERIVAKFLGKEDAIVFTMGYGTNATSLPALMGPESLLVSDALNHTSLVNGARGSGASIRVFKHNDAKHLDAVLKEAIINGQPKHHRPWRKIMVVVEGIYSMEGAICNLAEIVAVCKKYKAYIYVDEAHSIGALGSSGRGVCEHTGVDPADIDILMGTFTKSYGAMGGYVAGDKAVIDHLRATSAGMLYHHAMSPIVCQQVITAFKIIQGELLPGVGQAKIQALKDNSNFFRAEMNRLGLHVYGDMDSPIIPVLIYQPCKVAAFSRECLKRGLAVVVVGFPATTVVLARARFCISAGHTKQDLVKAVSIIEEVSDLLLLRYAHTDVGLDRYC
jgi:serine palmitoyltransferase